MKTEERKAAKQLYKQLRGLSWSALWSGEVPQFNASSHEERERRVAVIRAVAVVFAEAGPADDKTRVREWLLGLMHDPSEKVRRYAMAAMPKIGAGADEERDLLSVLETASQEREKKYLTRALGKIGGLAALEHSLPLDAEQKVKAGIARRENPSAVRFRGDPADFPELVIHLRGRAGLEQFAADEVEQLRKNRGKFRVTRVQKGRVAIVPLAPFSLDEVYAMRCFGTVGFVLGRAAGDGEKGFIESLATVITSPLSLRLLRAFTEGSIRYRLNFVARGHQRAAVAQLAGRIYTLCPEILNDARKVTWTVDIYPDRHGYLVEFRPNVTPDPRFSYRLRGVPAASHPPLAACLARLAGIGGNEVIWDPFCGSGSELIERAMLGGVRSALGTDCSVEAIAIAQANFAAAKLESVAAKFIKGDFRQIAAGPELARGTVTSIITNPPMGMRVPVADLRKLIKELFTVAVRVLKPGGSLVFVNPISMEMPHPLMKLQFRQKVDLGGFEEHMEKYLRVAQ